jgi:hypothetical protein
VVAGLVARRGSLGAPVFGGRLCSCRSSTSSPAGCSRSSCWSRATTARRTRTPRAAPRAVDRAAAGAAPAADGGRPATGRAEPRTASSLPGTRSSSHLRRCCAGTGGSSPPLDVPAAAAGPATCRSGGTPADPAPRAREHHWGYVRIVGELRKLGIDVSATLVRNVLRREGTRRRRGVDSWTGGRSCASTDTHDRRLRLFHRRHGLAAAAVRPVLHLYWDTTGRIRRLCEPPG